MTGEAGGARKEGQGRGTGDERIDRRDRGEWGEKMSKGRG